MNVLIFAAGLAVGFIAGCFWSIKFERMFAKMHSVALGEPIGSMDSNKESAIMASIVELDERVKKLEEKLQE